MILRTFSLALLASSTLLLAACQTTEEPITQTAATGFDPALSATTFEGRCQSQITALNRAITTLESVQAPYTIDSVLKPISGIERQLGDAMSQASLFENVHPDKTLREQAGECTSSLADIATRLGLSRPIFEAVSQVHVGNAAPDTRHYHDKLLRSFRLAGVDRDKETRDRIRELNDRITRLGQTFNRNILEDVRYIEVAPEQLAGLPEDYIVSKTVGENGKIRISTRYVDSIPVYTYAHSDEVRRLLRQQDRSRAYPQNEDVLQDLLAARHELAQILDFDHFADLVTADKMIGNAANARAFIEQVHDLATPAAEADMATLLEKLRQTKPDATEVQRWQSAYLEEQIRRDRFQVDATQVRQYFPYARVKQGIFDLTRDLFGVDIRPWDSPVWHPSVEAYELVQDGAVIARFYLDMHPREGKYQHAAAFSTQVGVAGQQLPISTLVCNFSGGADPNEPMEFDEVRTFLHEFGHLLHALFGGHQRWAGLSGIATEWDFVEAPSQMLEEWLYDPETLQSFAISNEGEVIPADLVERLNAARHFGEGMMTNVQMYYAALSLEFHAASPDNFDLTERMIELEQHYSPMPHQEDTYFYANLGHLNGYSAIYYTYMWSKVIALDMFSAFEKAGLRNTDTARHYRDTVLAPGGSKPAAQLVEDFLGRPYSFDAFARRLKADM